MVIGVSWDHRNDVRTRTSKALSYILRHGGPAVGLTFDEESFATVDDALQALYVLGRIHAQLTRAELLAVVDDPANPRFERHGDRIRARYGHSGAQAAAPPDGEPEAVPSAPPAPALVPETPPAFLFHGTSKEAADLILAGAGLVPRTRRYVHLSVDRDEARRVGRRHADEPVILRIDALGAAKAGAEFGRAAERTWLTPHVPVDYIRAERSSAGPQSIRAAPPGVSPEREPADPQGQRRAQRDARREQREPDVGARHPVPPPLPPKRPAQTPADGRREPATRPRAPEPRRTGHGAPNSSPGEGGRQHPDGPSPSQPESRRASTHHRRHRGR